MDWEKIISVLGFIFGASSGIWTIAKIYSDSHASTVKAGNVAKAAELKVKLEKEEADSEYARKEKISKDDIYKLYGDCETKLEKQADMYEKRIKEIIEEHKAEIKQINAEHKIEITELKGQIEKLERQLEEWRLGGPERFRSLKKAVINEISHDSIEQSGPTV